MTPRLPAVTAKQLVRVVERLGFEFRRQTGSHAIYVRPGDHARVVVPMHASELKRKTLRGILSDIKITVDQLRELL